MPGIRQDFLSLARKTGLSTTLDFMRFRWMQLKNAGRNRRFLQENQNIAFPPPYMVYESFQMDYAKYLKGGQEDANWIADLVRPFLPHKAMNILDWGCGPARIIRHLPGIMGHGHRYFGTDYNPSTIAWCKSHIQGISFTVNGIHPPLSFAEHHFDFLYGISIFTHLSLDNHKAWSNELYRVTAPKGIVLLTTHGDAFIEKLTAAESSIYQSGQLVVRSKTREGHRTFAAFHPPSLMRGLFTQSGFEILELIPGRRVHSGYISQDVWILRRP